MDCKQWDKTFAWLMAAFPQWKTDKGISVVWFSELKEFGADQVMNAVRDLKRADPSPFPPGIFEIKSKLEMRDVVFPAIAWQKVLLSSSRAEEVPSDLPEAARIAVQACGGMRAIGRTRVDQLPWIKKTFESCYQDALDKGKVDLISLTSGRDQISEGVKKMNQLVEGVVAAL